MKYTVKSISRQSGLAMQTIREYADSGLIGVNVDEQNRYRYFEANALNQTGAARRLRMMGFSLDETKEILVSVSRKRYGEMLGALVQRQKELLAYQKAVADMLDEHQRILKKIREGEACGWLENVPAMYCLNYRSNRTLLCESGRRCELLNLWMAQAVFTRNYSPYPSCLLSGGKADHVIGMIIPDIYAQYVPLEEPVFRREGGLHACFVIRHDDAMHILPDGPEHILDYIDENGLEITGEPYFIGHVPFIEDEKQFFYATLYVPVKKTNA